MLSTSLGEAETYNQTQQVVEHGDRLGNNPGNNPDAQADGHPSAGGQQCSLMHVVRTLATENSNVDILGCHVAEHNTGNNNLLRC